MIQPWKKLLWLWIIVVIGVTTSPWDQIVTHTHFDKINWIPLYGHAFSISDIIGNILLFAPVGWFYVNSRPDLKKRRVLINIFVISACLSLFAECSQIFIHTRYPATADWLCNTAGGILGGLVAITRKEARQKEKEISWSA
ncbi:MAG: VanZ family protein [Nitrospirales bacterium]|nr:VanZ family protein [Nitrospira sp.]MDR4502003.1 VanZ family protein [Nitrospirales bacterium]